MLLRIVSKITIDTFCLYIVSIWHYYWKCEENLSVVLDIFHFKTQGACVMISCTDKNVFCTDRNSFVIVVERMLLDECNVAEVRYMRELLKLFGC